jgi:hypothetical protein
MKDTTSKKLINLLISKKEFSKAEIIFSRIQGESIRLESFRLIVDELLQLNNYDDAFSLVNKYLDGNELIFHNLLIIKNQLLNSCPINADYLNQAMSKLNELGNDINSVKTHALLAEILFIIHEIELANKYNELAFTIWENSPMYFSELSHIILSLRTQHQSNKADKILNDLMEDVNCGDDLIAEANCRFEINELRSLLKDKTDVEENIVEWFEVEESNASLFNLNTIKTNALQFLSKPRSKRISCASEYNGTNHTYTLFDRLDNYLMLDAVGVKNKLNSLRSQLKSEGYSFQTLNKPSNKNIIQLLADYCALSQAFLMKQEFKISESILNHALSIAMNQFDSHHPSTLNFSSGPKYECLYLVCYHHLIQGKIDQANRILEDMENTYQSLGNQFNFFSLCDDTLIWISTYDKDKSEILKFLYSKAFDSIKSSPNINNVNYLVRILGANISGQKNDIVLEKLTELINILKNKPFPRDQKEACIIEVCEGLLKFGYLDNVIETIRFIEFTEKNLEEIHERIANFYLKKELDIINLFSKMKAHGRWLPDLNMRNILDEEIINELNINTVLPVIYLFSDRPENLEVLLSKFS